MPVTILHADDSPAVRRWVAEHLHDETTTVLSVADGQAALEVLEKTPCDLLLTDLEMPHLDGLELMHTVRGWPLYRFLPVLVFSTRKPSEIPEARRSGVTGWIVKPTNPEHLRRWVKRSLPG